MVRHPGSPCSRKLGHPWDWTGDGREGCLQSQRELEAWKRGQLVGEGVDEAVPFPCSSPSCPTSIRSLPWVNPVNSMGRTQLRMSETWQAACGSEMESGSGRTVGCERKQRES